MSRFYSIAGTVSALTLSLGGGCAAPALSPLSFTVRQSSLEDRAALVDIARAVLLGEGFELDQVDAAVGVVTTRPQPVSVRDARVRGLRISSPGSRRRIATVRIAREAAVTKVYCRVAVEEQTTESHRFKFEDEQTSDVPRETAIDRDAATTAEQNTVWQVIRRDKAAERSILSDILSRAGEPVSP